MSTAIDANVGVVSSPPASSAAAAAGSGAFFFLRLTIFLCRCALHGSLAAAAWRRQRSVQTILFLQ